MGSGYALEKIVKSIPVVMILIIGFIMRCELFHATAYNSIFAEYPALHCTVSDTEYKGFLGRIRELGKTGQSCIYVRWEKKNELEHILTIYTNSEEVKAELRDNNHISAGIYHSFFSGTMSIAIDRIEELDYEDFKINPHIIAAEDGDVVYHNLSEYYSVSKPEILQRTETDMMLIVWGLVSILLILINGASVMRKKKEVLLRVVYGEDLVQITVGSFVADLVLYEALYFVVRVFVFHFVSGDYKPYLAFLLYEIGCLAAAGINFIYLKADVRAVFSNVQDNKRTLFVLYALKMIAFAIVLLTVVTNLSNIRFSSLEKKEDESLLADNKDLLIAIDGYQNQSDPLANEVWKILYDNPELFTEQYLN